MNMAEENNIYDLIIIGGGPAGITAGIYAARAQLKVVLVTKDFLGELSNAFVLENYPGFEKIQGTELLLKLKSHLEKYKVEIIEGKQAIETTKQGNIYQIETDDHTKYLTKTIIVATGGMSRRIEIPGENEFLGKGVSYCAICDGFLYKDKITAVIGGGNSGLEAALYLANVAKKVYIFESSESLGGDKYNQERVAKRQDKIEVVTNAKIKEIKGQTKVEKIVFEQNGQEKEILTDGVFVYVGYVPVSDFVEKVVEIDQKGQIKVDPLTFQTSEKGIFAAGDVNDTPYKQAVIAAGQGATAELSVEKYLRENF